MFLQFSCLSYYCVYSARWTCYSNGDGSSQDDHSPLGMFFWLLIIWLIPFLGPLLYLLFGQRQSHVYFGQPSYSTPTQPIYQRH